MNVYEVDGPILAFSPLVVQVHLTQLLIITLMSYPGH